MLGDTLVVICAVAYSLHMIVLGSTGEATTSWRSRCVQLATVTVVCTVISAVKEQPGLPTDPAVIWAIVLTGVLASAVAFVDPDVGAEQAAAGARRADPGDGAGVRRRHRLGGRGVLADPGGAGSGGDARAA